MPNLPAVGNEIGGIMVALVNDAVAEPAADDEELGDPEEFPGSQFAALGQRSAPPVAQISVTVGPGTPVTSRAMEVLGEQVVRDIETQIAQSIISGAFNNRSWWLANKPETERQKLAKGQPANRPLVGTGELVRSLAEHTFPVEMEWRDDPVDGKNLLVSFGPRPEDDRDPSDKYKDMFFGARNVGHGRKTSVPSRYPRVTTAMQNSIEQAIANWSTNYATGMLTSVGTENEFINTVNDSGPDLFSLAGMAGDDED